MHLSDLFVLLVDVADLAREDEPHLAAARGRNLLLRFPREILAKPKEAFFGRHQLLADLLHPSRVGEVPGSEDRDALLEGGGVQGLEREVAARGAGIAGVDMKIGNELQRTVPICVEGRSLAT